MVRPSSILYLAIACLVAIAAAVAINSRSPAFTGSTGGQLLFPGLDAKINDAARITVTGGGHTLVVERGDKGWRLVSKEGYPAKLDIVKQTLLGLAQERTVEAKTAEPTFYPRLEVEDAAGKDAHSALLTVTDAKGVTLASLILGKAHPGHGGNGPQQLYVRKPDEARAWLAEGPLERNEDWKSWIDGAILALDRDAIAEVDVAPAAAKPDDKPYRLTHDKPGESDFALQDVPADQKVKDETAVNGIAAALTALKLDGVMAAKSLKPDAKLLRKLTFRRFDGLIVEIEEYGQDGKDWFKFAARYAPPASAPAPVPAAPAKPALAKPDDNAKAKVDADDIAARTRGWLYLLPPSDAAVLDTKLSDLLEPKAPPPPAKPKG
jgi:hypothetical protein